MQDNFQACLSFVLKEEGGYSDTIGDPGGITNFGVTLRTWQGWVGHAVTAQDMKALTPEDVTPLYRIRYWNIVDGNNMPAGLDLCLFDAAVNQGPGTAIRMLQKVVGVTVDGILGPQTISACSPSDIDSFCDARLERYAEDPNYARFGKGWTNRVAACRLQAHVMAATS